LVEGARSSFFKKLKQILQDRFGPVPRNSWQLWSLCIDGKNLYYSYRSVLNVQIFTLDKERLEELNTNFPEDFAK